MFTSIDSRLEFLVTEHTTAHRVPYIVVYRQVLFLGHSLVCLSRLCFVPVRLLSCRINCLSCVFTPGRSTVMLAAANGDPGKDEQNKMLLLHCCGTNLSYLYYGVCSCVADYLFDVERPLKFVVL